MTQALIRGYVLVPVSEDMPGVIHAIEWKLETEIMCAPHIGWLIDLGLQPQTMEPEESLTDSHHMPVRGVMLQARERERLVIDVGMPDSSEPDTDTAQAVDLLMALHKCGARINWYFGADEMPLPRRIRQELESRGVELLSADD